MDQIRFANTSWSCQQETSLLYEVLCYLLHQIAKFRFLVNLPLVLLVDQSLIPALPVLLVVRHFGDRFLLDFEDGLTVRELELLN